MISQDTGFSNVFPTGEGLFGFSTMDEILAAVDAINSDYARHSRAAEEIAREYFAHDVVLGRLLADVGVDLLQRAGLRGEAPRDGDPFPPDLDLEPVSRRPTRLRAETAGPRRVPPGAGAPAAPVAGLHAGEHRDDRARQPARSPAWPWRACWPAPSTRTTS